MRNDTLTYKIGFAMLCSALFAGGCKKPSNGPKREDHEAAHTARYHPDMQRQNRGMGSDESVQQLIETVATQPAGQESYGSPVLFVNGDTLTVPEVLEPVLPRLREKVTTLSRPNYYRFAARTIAEEIRNQISVLLVYDKAILTYPDGVKEVLDKRADALIADVINARFGGVDARYEAYLAELGLTLDDIRKRARRQILVSEFLHERFDPMLAQPSRKELLQAYENNIEQFSTEASAEMLLIEIPIESELDKPLTDAGDEEIAEAKASARSKLQRAIEELKNGAEFEEVAERYSKGVRAETGGNWGEITRGSLTKRWAEAEKVLFQLDSGQISDVFEAGDSLFVVKCGKKTEAHTLSFEKAQEQLIRQSRSNQYSQLTSQYIADLIRNSTIGEKQHRDFLLAVVAAAPQPAKGTAQSGNR